MGSVTNVGKMTQVSNQKSSDDPSPHSEWIRKLTPKEEFMAEFLETGNMQLWYQLDLSSSNPLQEDQVRRAVIHLYKKVPSLGVSINRRGGEMWFRKATNPDVDFEVHHGVEIEEVRAQLRKYHYKSETGPLFCARLIHDSPGVTIDPYGIEPTLPHKCYIMFGLHHAITDGISNMYIMGFFVSLLNDVLAGKPINDGEPLGTFVSNEETAKLLEKQKSVLESDSDLRKKIAYDIQFPKHHIPLIYKLHSEPREEPRTGSAVATINPEVTSRFLQRCREEKITVNSAVTAILNTSIVKVAIDEGINFDADVLHNYHTINLRRYWKKKAEKPLGLHMEAPATIYIKTSRGSLDNFWDYARNIGESMREYVSSGRILAVKAYEQFFSGGKPSNDLGVISDFMTSNMGNVTNMVTEGGSFVKVTNIKGGSTFHKTPHPILANFFTFRGIFTMNLDYNTHIIQIDIVEKILSQVMKSIREIAH